MRNTACATAYNTPGGAASVEDICEGRILVTRGEPEEKELGVARFQLKVLAEDCAGEGGEERVELREMGREVRQRRCWWSGGR